MACLARKKAQVSYKLTWAFAIWSATVAAIFLSDMARGWPLLGGSASAIRAKPLQCSMHNGC